MLKRFFPLILLCLVCLIPLKTFGAEPCAKGAKEKAKTTLQEAKKQFKQSYTISTFKQAFQKADEAAIACPAYEAAWSFKAQAAWMTGEFMDKKAKKERVAWYKKGEQAAQKALAINADSVGGHYWLAANMAGRGDAKGWATSLWMFPKLLKHMDRVDQLDPHYIYGATDRFWCEVLNRVPLTLADKFGYKVEDIIADLEAEIKNEPRFFANYYYAAKINWKAGKKEKAIAHLEHVVNTDPGVFPEEKTDNAFHKQLAEKLLAEYKK